MLILKIDFNVLRLVFFYFIIYWLVCFCMMRFGFVFDSDFVFLMLVVYVIYRDIFLYILM